MLHVNPCVPVTLGSLGLQSLHRHPPRNTSYYIVRCFLKSVIAILGFIIGLFYKNNIKYKQKRNHKMMNVINKFYVTKPFFHSKITLTCDGILFFVCVYIILLMCVKYILNVLPPWIFSAPQLSADAISAALALTQAPLAPLLTLPSSLFLSVPHTRLAYSPQGLCSACQTCCSPRSSIPRCPHMSLLSPFMSLLTCHLKQRPSLPTPHETETASQSCQSTPDPALFLFFVATVTI